MMEKFIILSKRIYNEPHDEMFLVYIYIYKTIQYTST